MLCYAMPCYANANANANANYLGWIRSYLPRLIKARTSMLQHLPSDWLAANNYRNEAWGNSWGSARKRPRRPTTGHQYSLQADLEDGHDFASALLRAVRRVV